MAPSLPPILLSATIAAGVYFLHGLGWNPGGLMPMLGDIVNTPDAKFPGTSQPLKRSFIGVTAIDTLLFQLNTFFAHVVDGSSPSLSLFGIFMAGQYGMAWGLMVLEGLREGNKGKVVSYVGAFGIVMQMIGFAVVFPIYLLTHTLTSPLASRYAINTRQNAHITPTNLTAFPFAFAIGYLFPTALITNQTSDMALRQNLLAIWQVFPFWTTLTQTILSLIIGKSDPTSNSKPAVGAYRAQLDSTYTFLLSLGMITYIPALLLTLYPYAAESVFPWVTKGLVEGGVTFATVYVPYAPLLSWRAKDLAEGAHVFLQWDTYVGSTAATIWALRLQKSIGLSASVSKVVFWTLVAGPFGGITMLIWERDVTVVDDGLKSE